MMHVSKSVDGDGLYLGTLVTTAARGWRKARDRGLAVQRHLHVLLSPSDCGMLAPVFDSLMSLYELALKRRFVAGGEGGVSDDERLLFRLLGGSHSCRASIDCAEDTARTLDCALCSARIMMALTLPARCRAGHALQ